MFIAGLETGKLRQKQGVTKTARVAHAGVHLLPNMLRAIVNNEWIRAPEARACVNGRPDSLNTSNI